MHKHRPNPSEPIKNADGYSILELVIVAGILSILAGISVPRIGNIITSSKIDEAKALLNTTAADCLQKSRLNSEKKHEIDDTIISDQRLKPIGFEIDSGNDANKCSYFQIIPTDPYDSIRYPIGFSVSDGLLSKFATPTSTEQGSIASCERWAGVNCRQDESLKKLIEWKQNIAAEKAQCEDRYEKWLTSENTTPYKSERWNPNAETGCPSRPAEDGSESYRTDPTCTPNGCNRNVYGLDGEFVGFTKEDYDKALENKYGNLCTEWVAEQERQQITNDTNQFLPITKTPECGSQEFWFFKGEDQGSREKFMETACNDWIKDKKSQKYTNEPFTTPITNKACGNQNFWFINGEALDNQAAAEMEACESKHEEWRSKGENKRYEPIGGPGPCGEEIFVCKNSLVKDSIFYSTEGCGLAPQICGCFYAGEEPYCKEHELSSYMMDRCGARPDTDKDSSKRTPDKCGIVGKGRPSIVVDGWDSTPECGKWARCMTYYNEKYINSQGRCHR